MAANELSKLQKPEIQAFLDEPNIARIATCDPDTLQPHAVPVWYEWDGEQLWISSFSATRKIQDLRKNPQISITVDTDSRGEPARAVIFEGEAELIADPQLGVERGTRIYTRYLGEEGANGAEPQSWLHDPQHLLIRLKPKKVYTWGL